MFLGMLMPREVDYEQNICFCALQLDGKISTTFRGRCKVEEMQMPQKNIFARMSSPLSMVATVINAFILLFFKFLDTVFCYVEIFLLKIFYFLSLQYTIMG